ncbi:MAG: UDP-glucose 4-epimerase GalE [Bradymonadales bacterium]|nr:MAG: UDP-glucose 4-epimerase GalE [Bradymonadales bacterium]
MKLNPSKDFLLVTGGCGYIGSHTTVVLQKAGFQVLILDNLKNSKPKVLSRIQEITGQRPEFVEGDIRDAKGLEALFQKYRVSACLHFAGLKAVGESVEQPLNYYENNVQGSLQLFKAMKEAGVKRLVFSSSATVYGQPKSLPLSESASRQAENPYGQTKLMIEHILEDLCRSDLDWSVMSLRYFNPVGAHPSGMIGEDPLGIPNNLMPYISQVAVGRRKKLQVFGNDYPTSDGTGIRDYIHVMDLAEGHLAALRAAFESTGFQALNLGTGKAASVLELVQAFEQASGVKIDYEIVQRRPGDIAECWADPRLAREKLNWSCQRGLIEMCADSWNWQQKNPQGYD